jgi:O-antigen ligase
MQREEPGDGWAAGVLAATILLAPALGSTSDAMLQDTFKSAIVSFGTLVAALLFLLAQRERSTPLHWHAILWLPLLLLVHALGSMAWSHPYLAGVEAVRWFVFALVAWLGLNTFTRERLPVLAGCVHAGAVLASLWAALQFWIAFDLFPQGPNPASTFINRNFFAEFAISALPFGALLVARSGGGLHSVLLAASVGFVLVAILMSGTRSALVTLWLLLLVVLPAIAWRCRRQLAWSAWPARRRALVAATFGLTVLALGSIPSGNPKIIQEGHGAAPLLRGSSRTQSIGPADASLNLRLVMWRATVDAIRDRPLAGLGAGAWENRIPLYLPEGSQLETDYYAHNEPLQLLAEYGLAGWAFLLLLAGYLLQAAWRGWREEGPQADADRPWRAVFLCSLLALLVVSNAGFPWRLAATGMLFALCLGALAALDARRMDSAPRFAARLRWSPRIAGFGVAATLACLALALLVLQRAAESERKLVAAVRIARAITAAGDYRDPRHDAAKREMLQSVREGIAANRHYRKITPMVADELARWGDWRNATWIWESVLESRPYVVAILTNAARGYSAMGQEAAAMHYLERARRVQPRAASVRSLEVLLLARRGQEQLALQKAQDALAAGIEDHDLVNAAAILHWRAGDAQAALRLLQRRMERWPDTRALGHIQMGTVHAELLGDPEQALAQFRAGLALAGPAERAGLLEQVPLGFRAQLQPGAAAGS